MWRNFLRSSKPTPKEPDKEEDIESFEITPEFDKKYKIILKFKSTDEYYDMLDWVNKNSNNSVDIKRTWNLNPSSNSVSIGNIFVAFENEDDATFFRIKYTI